MPGSVDAGTINGDSFRIDIATNLAWMDNNSNPLVQIASSRQSAMQRAVAEANPFIRITNVSTDAKLAAAQLNLSNAESKIDRVEWISTPGRASWLWDPVAKHAHFQFADPVLPGQSATMHVSTVAQAGAADNYSMFQELFTPTASPRGTGTYFGILQLFAQAGTSSGPVAFDAGTSLPVGEFASVSYDLRFAPVRTYAISDQDGRVGIQTRSGTVVAVPEPGTLAMAFGGLATLVGWRVSRSRKAGGMRRLLRFC